MGVSHLEKTIRYPHKSNVISLSLWQLLPKLTHIMTHLFSQLSQSRVCDVKHQDMICTKHQSPPLTVEGTHSLHLKVAKRSFLKCISGPPL